MTDDISALFADFFDGSGQASAPALARTGDEAIADALEGYAAEEEQAAKDWAQRRYKPNGQPVPLRGDGPVRRESLSVSEINERRRWHRVEAHEKSAMQFRELARQVRLHTIDLSQEIDRLEKAIDSDPMVDPDHQENPKDGLIAQRLFGEEQPRVGPGSPARIIRNFIRSVSDHATS